MVWSRQLSVRVWDPNKGEIVFVRKPLIVTRDSERFAFGCEIIIWKYQIVNIMFFEREKI